MMTRTGALMRFPAPCILLLGAVAVATGWCDGLEPWASNADPSDVAKSHVQEISDGRTEYAIVQGGTMDGTNCRQPIGYAAWDQSWESNRSVRLENTGQTDIVNPWLSNGRNNFRTIPEIVAGALEPGMTDEEKAIAVWRWETSHRFHAYTADDEVNDPVKVFNVYGYTLCGNDAICLSGLWRDAGLTVRPARPTGHCVTEVFYDGEWHLLDGDEHCIFLRRDNRTIASEAEIVRDHDLIKRTHTYGILSNDDPNRDEFSASLYIFDGEGGGNRDCRRGHDMRMTLRPGEALTWRWGHLEPYKFHGKEDIKGWGPRAIAKICNGLWEYRPDFGGDVWRDGVEEAEGVAVVDGQLRAADGGQGHVTWKMQSPYVFVGGRIEAEGAGKFTLSWDGNEWHTVGNSMDEMFPPDGPARYSYLLRCELAGQAALSKLAVINDIQMAPLSLPGMVVGDNQFAYTDETEGPREARITHSWVERSASRPPAAPGQPVFPGDGSVVEGTQFAFEWEASQDEDGDEIADYHFELYNRPDLKWPLSPNFTKLISNTADRGNARYTLTSVGLLSPDDTYYWRVRARDARGLWGPWSDVWTFTVDTPMPPVNIALQFDQKHQVGVLTWEPNPSGRTPSKYRVYGSDEKGFTVSDEEYRVNLGNQPTDLTNPFPANFVAEVAGTRLEVIGQGLEFPNANRAHYRVVAVDDRGHRSWSSDFVDAPRPLIVSAATAQGKAGEEFSHQVRAIRSLGDLRCRTMNNTPYNSSFWDIEKPVFELAGAPAWLKLDAKTGLLSGVPDAPGEISARVGAAIEGRPRVEQALTIVVTQ